MARTSTYPLVDRALDGKLGELLEAWQTEGVSLAEMAYRLRSEHDVKVSASTIGRWLTPEPAEAAS